MEQDINVSEKEESEEYKPKSKSFSLSSSWGMTPIARISICSEIKTFDDKITISTTPKKYNTIPVIYKKDITDLQISNKIAPFMIVVAIICIAFGFYGYYWAFLIAPIWIFLGFNKKITIYLRSGMSTSVYSSSKSDAEEFYEYINNIIK